MPQYLLLNVSNDRSQLLIKLYNRLLEFILASIIYLQLSKQMSYAHQPEHREPVNGFMSQLPAQNNQISAKQVKASKVSLAEQELSNLYKKIVNTRDVTELAASIKEYCVVLVANNSEELFINHFVESKFMALLSEKIKQHKSSSQFLKSIFSLFQFLLKALRREEELIYFLIRINQQGFISSTYSFKDEEDIAYYANFLKLMIRKINEEDKYLSVFINLKEPHFPLLLKLLKFYDCPDVVMHTSSKLAIMEISNNQNPLVQKFTKNFPFVIFYPLYVGIILDSLRKAVYEENNELHIQNLENHLKFMEDFIANKEKEAIDIYTNTFLKTIGLFIYMEVSSVSEKSIKRVKKLYKILIEYVIPQLSVIKIKTSLLLLFNTDISSKMKKCFSGKMAALQTGYWLLDECLNEVIDHCKKIHFFNDQGTKSIFKTINSYIPRSKDNWLYYEMKKISEQIGFNVSLDEPINHDVYLPDSFLNALWTMIDDKFEPNDIFHSLLKIKDQELLYYHLKLMTQLANCYNHQIKLNMELLVQQMCTCNSLSLIQIFYLFVLNNKLDFQDSTFIISCYDNITEKLIHFIMTRGMKEFLIRIKDSRVKEYQNDFFQDIYREIQCEILLFAALRTILGSPNDSSSKFDINKWDNNSNLTAQTAFKCRGTSQVGPELTAILDGQYLKIKNRNDHLIHKQELLLQNVRFYEEKNSVVLDGNEKTNHYSTTIFIDEEIKYYMLKEISYRKDLAMKITLIVKDMHFDFQY